MTVRLPEQARTEESLPGAQKVLWRRDALTRVEIAEAEIGALAQAVTAAQGSIVALEPKRRSLEELFLNLSGQGEKQAGDGQ